MFIEVGCGRVVRVSMELGFGAGREERGRMGRWVSERGERVAQDLRYTDKFVYSVPAFISHHFAGRIPLQCWLLKMFICFAMPLLDLLL